MSERIEGRCLCGAVTITATIPDTPVLRACHCDMCRRQNSSMFMSLEADQESIEVLGPQKIHVSSDWAQRAFCETCGSTLWYGLRQDGSRNLSAGLFKNAGGGTLVMEYFSDQCPQGYTLAGDHARMTRAETYAMFAPDAGDAT